MPVIEGWFDTGGRPRVTLRIAEVDDPIPLLIDTTLAEELLLPLELVEGADIPLWARGQYFSPDRIPHDGYLLDGQLVWFGRRRDVQILSWRGAGPTLPA